MMSRPPLHAEIVQTLSDLSDLYPSTLTAITSGVGYAAMNLLDSGGASWESFTTASLHGPQLGSLVAYKTFRYREAGVTGNLDLETELPQLFDRARCSVITSTYELSRGQSGKLLSCVDSAVEPGISRRVQNLLTEHAQSRRVVLDLFAQSQTVLLEDGEARQLGEAYCTALLGGSSDAFPDMADIEDCEERRRILRSSLADAIWPLLLDRAVRPIGEQYELTDHQMTIFSQNIARS